MIANKINSKGLMPAAGIVLGCVISLGSAVTASAASIAFITDVKGDAQIGTFKATLMGELEKGARISCVKDCQVGVMYVVSGKEFVIRGPGDFLVGEADVTAKVGSAPSTRQTAWKVSSQTVTTAAQSASASIRMRSIDLKAISAPPLPDRLLYPIEKTKVLSLQPDFRWQALNAKGPYEFELVLADGATPKAIYKTKQSNFAVKLPASIKLQADTAYAWQVNFGGANIAKSQFRTLPAHLQETTQRRKPDGNAVFSDWLLYALTLQELGAKQDAQEVWSKLAKDRPDLPELSIMARPPTD